jgi:hypothetical protein
MVGHEGWTLYNEEWCFVQDEISNRLRQYMSTTKAQKVMKEETTRGHYVTKIT